MPIFDQGYQHWQGKLAGHSWRWLAVTRQGFRALTKNRLARLVMLIAVLPGAVLALFLVFWGLVEQKSTLVAPLAGMFFQGPLQDLAVHPENYRVTVWTLAYYYFFQVQMFLSMILVVIVGPSLISQDLRFNAIPLYFSRPLRRFDYFAGKLGVIAAALGTVLVMPTVVAYLLGLAFSLDVKLLKDTGRVLFAALAYAALIVVCVGMLMLALSSLSRNSRYVAVMWLGLWLVSNAAGALLTNAIGTRFVLEDNQGMRYGRRERVADSWTHLVSYTENLHRVGEALLDTESAYRQLGKLQEAFLAQLNNGRTGTFFVPEPAPSKPGVKGKKQPAMRRVTLPQAAFQPRPEDTWPLNSIPNYPWSWSAGVLAGLLGISLWILTFRVKSLDRLR